MPVNVNELKEVYDLIYESEYKSTTLFSKYRHVDSFQFQAFVFAYTFLKYNKKVRDIPYKYIQNKFSITGDYNTSLFCINTGSIYYSSLSFLKTKIIMEYLFPIPTPYEINNNILPNISLNVVYTMEKEIEDNQNQYNNLKMTLKIYLFLSIFINILLIIFWKFEIFQKIKMYKNIYCRIKEEDLVVIK